MDKTKTTKKRKVNGLRDKDCPRNNDLAYSEEAIKRFHSSYTKNTDNGCWEWHRARQKPSTKHQLPYGIFTGERIGDERVPQRQAHRASWIIHNGPILNGLHVMHKCDNPPCCNPEHLKLGTHQDNMADKFAKGRHYKIADAVRVAVRACFATGQFTRKQLAPIFGISYISVLNILKEGK